LKERKTIVIWPIYFNSKSSRSKGRRIASRLAIEEPTLEELIEAIRKLNLEYIIEKDKVHPRSWWKDKGRILVTKQNKKSELLKKIAIKLKEIRYKKEEKKQMKRKNREIKR